LEYFEKEISLFGAILFCPAAPDTNNNSIVTPKIPNFQKILILTKGISKRYFL
jgi:hypothetical protein